MTGESFINFCKGHTSMETGVLYDKYVDNSDIFVVWYNHTLNNKKALLASNLPDDDFYYEYTYDSKDHKIYLDKYKLFRHSTYDTTDMDLNGNLSTPTTFDKK